MTETLKTPEITYRMTSVALQEPTVARTTGKLTIAGTTRDIKMDVTIAKDANGQYILAGKTPIRMTDYGMKPPVTMMGTLKTGDDVIVSFRWVVTATK